MQAVHLRPVRKLLCKCQKDNFQSLIYFLQICDYCYEEYLEKNYKETAKNGKDDKEDTQDEFDDDSDSEDESDELDLEAEELTMSNAGEEAKGDGIGASQEDQREERRKRLRALQNKNKIQCVYCWSKKTLTDM